MGSSPKEPERSEDEGPQHEVKLESFFISQTPITQAQWREVAGWQERPGEQWGRELMTDPSEFQSKDGQGESKVRLLEGESNTDQRPVEQVRWEDAMEFCLRLSQRTGRIYTLPSEAQWEYACRAGTTTVFYFGDNLSPELANYDGNYVYFDGHKGVFPEQTLPVETFPANAWGLHDMHGNVREWCMDAWHGSYDGAPSDCRVWVDGAEGQKGNETGSRRLLRGGSWINPPVYCRSAYRTWRHQGSHNSHIGFRVCCLPQD
jgi:formylglycine-generating enzyme required for sulfatase activity